MYFTQNDSALILIDHQVETMHLIQNLEIGLVERHTIDLAKIAKILKLPIVLSSLNENRRGPLLPGLAALLPEANAARIQREGTVNAWDDARFRQAVEATGRKNLIMAGVTTGTSLVFPSIDAVAAGYRVQAVVDASGAVSELAEEIARLRMRDGGVVLTSTTTLIAELAKDWNTPNGMALMEILFSQILQAG